MIHRMFIDKNMQWTNKWEYGIFEGGENCRGELHPQNNSPYTLGSKKKKKKLTLQTFQGQVAEAKSVYC